MLRAVGLSQRVRRRPALPGSLDELFESLRCTTSTTTAASSAAAADSGDPPLPPPAGEASAATAERLAKVMVHAFHKAPKEMASALLKELTELDRIHLVLELQKSTNRARLQQETTAWVDDLVRKQVARSEENQSLHSLTRAQIENAVKYQRMLQKFTPMSEQPPPLSALVAVAMASGLPFFAFGCLDNGIMLVAGEQIDHLFGAKMGLSTLASAALGNMVADVVGVSATHTVQENIKKIPFARPPRLSMLQQNLTAVKTAQLLGAAIGVAIGCLVGMTPLAFMDAGFFVSASTAAADVASSAAAAMGGAGAEEAAASAAAAAAAAAGEAAHAAQLAAAPAALAAAPEAAAAAQGAAEAAGTVDSMAALKGT